MAAPLEFAIGMIVGVDDRGPPYDVCRILGSSPAAGGHMGIAAAMFQVVGVLREAQHSDGHVLLAKGVTDGLVRILPADEVTLIDMDLRHHQDQLLELLDNDYRHLPPAGLLPVTAPEILRYRAGRRGAAAAAHH